MKGIFLIILILCITSCHEENDNGSDIVGTWVIVSSNKYVTLKGVKQIKTGEDIGAIITFNNDMTYSTSGGKMSHGTWVQSKNTVIFHYKDSTSKVDSYRNMKITSLNHSNLIVEMNWKEGDSIEYEKDALLRKGCFHKVNIPTIIKRVIKSENK